MKDERNCVLHPSAFIFQPFRRSLPLHLMQRVLAQTLAELLDLDLLRSAGHLDLGAVVQVTGLGALKPDVFAGFLSHCSLQLRVSSYELRARILLATRNS